MYRKIACTRFDAGPLEELMLFNWSLVMLFPWSRDY